MLLAATGYLSNPVRLTQLPICYRELGEHTRAAHHNDMAYRYEDERLRQLIDREREDNE